MTSAPAFLFDLDGTLADTLPDIAASTNFVRARHNLPPLPLAAVRTFVGDGARALLARALAEVLPGADDDRAALLDAAMASYTAHHEAQCTVHARLMPGVALHLDRLLAAGHALAVVTNKPERLARFVLAHLGVADLFGAIVGGDTLPERKPSPGPLLAALRELRAPTAGATMVGDGVPDLRAGRAAGLSTIACLYGYGDPAALRACGPDACWSAFGVAVP